MRSKKDNDSMHIAVIGAGVAGIATAFYLTQKGCRVTLIESASAVGKGASFANGAQLSYSFADPMAKPQMLKALPRLLLGKDRSSVLRMDGALISWGLKFLLQCTEKNAKSNLRAALSVTRAAEPLLDVLMNQVPLECHKVKAGKLVLLNSKTAIEHAHESARLKRQAGFNTEVISYDEAVELEPTLSHFAQQYLGAVYSPNDAVADAHAFCLGLADWLQQHTDTTILTSTRALSLTLQQKSFKGVLTDQGNVGADAVVVCTGAWSKTLLQRCGINVPIYPVRGYSVTLPVTPASPLLSITDPAARIVLTRLGNQMRIAGFADFSGFDTTADDTRCRTLLDTAKALSPMAADFSSSIDHAWGGFRPMTPNGLPLVGRSSLPGVFLNTGHGMLGWTMACATGHTVAEHISGHSTP